MDATEIYSNLSIMDREVLKRFRIVLKECQNLYSLTNRSDRDILSYRLLNILKQEVNLDIYERYANRKTKRKSAPDGSEGHA